MAHSTPVHTLMVVATYLSSSIGQPLDDPMLYCNIVGSLQYLMFTRPDIAFVVNKPSQFMHRPTMDHWQGVKQVLRYLSGSRSLCISLSREIPLVLHAFFDADWGGDRDDLCSTGGHVVYLGRNPITWSSKKQRSSAKSSIEAEYKSVSTYCLYG